MSQIKAKIIRAEDSKEYLSYQFEKLKNNLLTFDYNGMAQIIDAAHHVFMEKIEPDPHAPDPILLDRSSLK